MMLPLDGSTVLRYALQPSWTPLKTYHQSPRDASLLALTTRIPADQGSSAAA